MYDRKQRLIEVFQDTQNFYTENEQLAAAVTASKKGTRLYGPEEYPALPEKRKTPVQIEVTKSTSFMAANQRYFIHGREHIAVLNFASAVNPGGGVKSGSSAQEESLCRCSTLYPTLNQQFLWEKYYEPNRTANDPLHSDACIWSPGIVICKLDASGNPRIDPAGWVTVDVISCAAPNLRERTGNIHNPETAASVRLTSDEQYAIHLKRAKHIMSSLAQEESRSISLNVTWGQRKRFADGKATAPFSVFLGYDRGENGEFVVNPEQAEIVRIIYGEFLKGFSFKAIAKKLTEMGIKSPKGKDRWNESTIKSILTNEKYKGCALLQKHYTADYLTK